jgi:hypothetical protein
MRVSPLLLALVALALVAPTAGASPIATGSPAIGQDLRSPDARDAAVRATDPKPRPFWSYRYRMDPKQSAALLAQEQYYSSYGEPTPAPPRSAAHDDDDSPWLTIGLGVGLIALVAGAVALAVRTRRRPPRVRVA